MWSDYKRYLGEIKNMWFATPKDDGGFLSRKLVITILAMLLITTGAFVSAWWPIFAASYGTFVGGILGCLGIYLTGNVTNKFLTDKNAVKAAEVVPVTTDSKKEPAKSKDDEEAD